jgi:hypothetical protein
VITEEEILETELLPTQGMLRCIDDTGDTKVIWDRNSPDEVAAAQETFRRLKKKGYLAYEVTGKDGAKGAVVDEFNPDAERLILAPRMVGG